MKKGKRMTLTSTLNALKKQLPNTVFSRIVRGIEKENLRIDKSGNIAQTAHPSTLGKALTSPHITTDFSEALPELITPPLTGIANLQSYLLTLNRFVYDHLDQETLWPFSMPPKIDHESDVGIAQYGQSNSAKMKTIYRVGLSNRYGRIMQAIAGIHFNLSFPDALFTALQATQNNRDDFKTFRSNSYMKLIRHFHCHAWLLPYLFGASPICFNSSVKSAKDYLKPLDADAQFSPWGTSLRMSDLGYQNNAQKDLNIAYDSIQTYAASLLKATQTPNAAFEKIGVKIKGQYKQLNANILQIENEYYSFIRPKPKPEKQLRPAVALCKNGVEYIEVRLLDSNPALPLGIDEETIAFLDLFLLFNLISSCCQISLHTCHTARDNFKRVATRGRDPNLSLAVLGGEKPFKEVALNLLDDMQPLAVWLDDGNAHNHYQNTLAKQIAKVHDASLTPSATLLAQVKKSNLSYAAFCLTQAKQIEQFISSQNYDSVLYADLKKNAVQSITDWQATEEAPQDFDTFLQNYFS